MGKRWETRGKKAKCLNKLIKMMLSISVKVKTIALLSHFTSYFIAFLSHQTINTVFTRPLTFHHGSFY